MRRIISNNCNILKRYLRFTSPNGINPKRFFALSFNKTENNYEIVPKLTVRDALCKAMEHEMDLDPKVYLIGEEVGQYDGAYKVTRGLLAKFGPKRIIDTPITETGFTGLAVGSSMHGLKPICEFMTWNFSLQSIDHIINSAAKVRYMSAGQITAPVVFRGPNGYSAGTAAQHSQNLAQIYMACPGLKVVAPYSAEEAYGLLRTSIQDEDPVVFLEHELAYGLTFENVKLQPLPLGKSKIEREGNDVTIVTYSLEVKTCLEAAKILSESQDSIECEILNLRTLRPLDFDSILTSLKKTKHLVVVDASWPQCSVASEIVARVCESEQFYELDGPPCRVTMADVPMPYSQPLEEAVIPCVENVVKTVRYCLHKL